MPKWTSHRFREIFIKVCGEVTALFPGVPCKQKICLDTELLGGFPVPKTPPEIITPLPSQWPTILSICMVGSSVLVKNEAKGHVLIYYVSKVFTKVEMKYVEIEK